jgi:predicted dehydrogenase
MSKAHLPALYEVPEIDVVAVCDIDEGRLNAIGDAFNVATRYTDYHAMFAAENLDIVAIATQGPQHCAATVAAAAHGVHVLCEKPMALDLTEADQMVAACDQAGVKLAINHQATVRPSLKRVRSMIENGDIGDVILVRGNNKSGRKAGNELMEMGTHVFDRMQFLGGAPQWCFAHLTWEGRAATIDHAMDSQEMSPRDRASGMVLGERAYALFGMERAPVGECQFLGYAKTNSLVYSVDVLGTKGQISLRGTGTQRGNSDLYHLPVPAFYPADLQEESLWQRIDVPEELDPALGRESITPILQEFIKSIETDSEHPCSGEAGRYNLEMVMAMYTSHLSGQRVSIPLANRTHPLAAQ